MTTKTTKSLTVDLINGHYVIMDADDNRIATIDDEVSRDKEVATLFASAPDLYEACKFALESGDDLEAVRKIKAAMAKADGKTEGENK